MMRPDNIYTHYRSSIITTIINQCIIPAHVFSPLLMNYFTVMCTVYLFLYGFWEPGTTMTMRQTLHFAVTDCCFRVEKCRNYKCITTRVYSACLLTVFAWIIPCLPVSVRENRFGTLFRVLTYVQAFLFDSH